MKDGSAALPTVAFLLVITTSFFGTWGILRNWRHLVEIQGQLDRCVGSAALELQDKLGRIESANTRIRALRLALAGSTAAPQARLALQSLLEWTAARQELDRTQWKIRQGNWLLGRGCSRQRGSFTLPLPSLGYFRPPRDLIGPHALEWERGTAPSSWVIRAKKYPRSSFAQVSRKKTKGVLHATYSAKWISSQDLGPDFH